MPQIAGSLDTVLPPVPDNVGRMILDRIAATPDAPAYRAPNADGTWRTLTWREAGDDMIKLAAGLVSLGLGIEDRVAIASGTRLEWILADAAVMLAGGTTTTIYPSTSADDFTYILADSGARFLFAEDAKQVAKAAANRDETPDLATIITIDGEGGDGVHSWEQLKEAGVRKLAEDPKVIESIVGDLTRDHLATMIYTSGTTGRPKGVLLPHGNWVFQAASVQSMNILRPDDVQYLWLPLSHVFGKVLLGSQVLIGVETAVDGRVDKIVENLPAVRPTVMAGVPRVFEKIYQGANAKAKEAGGAKARIFDWAFSSAIGLKAKQRGGQSLNPVDRAQLGLADRLVFSKIRELTGGRMRLMISGSAALNGDVARWFDAAGLPIIEGYGLTENTAAAAIVRPDDLVFGSVGAPMPGTEVRIADDGEVLLRGPHIMTGYWNLPDATGEALLEDGWLATGDIGQLDDQGRLKITDRKKDLVKTSGGKYIAPGQIAARFKVVSSLASNLVVHANDRNYATALVSLDPDALNKFAAEKGLTGDFATLSQSPEVREQVQADIDRLNDGLNRWETIKKFAILDRDLTEEAGELTASLKVKRKVVEQHFADLLDAMYT